MKYIVVKSEMDIERAMSIITDKKNTNFEYGIRFKTPDGKTFCNVFVHRIYYDYSSVVSGDPIDHYDIVGPAEFVGNHGVITNIENSSPNAIYYSLNDELEVIYDNIFDKTKDTTFYRKWEKSHDTETGFANIPKNKRYKIKSKSIK